METILGSKRPWNARKAIALFLIIGLVFPALIVAGSAMAGETAGEIVFDALEKVRENQSKFNGDILILREKRREWSRQLPELKRNLVEKEYGTLAWHEAHANFVVALAHYFSLLDSELEATLQLAELQHGVLSELDATLARDTGAAGKQGTDQIVYSTLPALENARDLFHSFEEYRDFIKDPAIIDSMNKAGSVAKMLAAYVEGKKRTSQAGASADPRAQVREMQEEFYSIYSTARISRHRVREEAARLAIANQIAEAMLTSSSLREEGKSVGKFRAPLQKTGEEIRRVSNMADSACDIGPGHPGESPRALGKDLF